MAYYTDTGFGTAIQRPSFRARITAAFELRKQRKALYSLTDEQLNDVGLTRADAAKEYSKSIWAL
ncbi:MAG: DUF1127 domain-containing protein [Amylibacter sp.]|nr:DUF1127 domain-containing protein [Amylibacter sp.]